MGIPLAARLVHKVNWFLPQCRGKWFAAYHATKHSFTFDGQVRARVNGNLLMDLDLNADVDALIYFNCMDPEVQRWIIKNVKAGDTVLDIGANIGFFTLLMAKLVGSTGKVHAFEPNPEIARRHRNNVCINAQESSVLLHECALADITGSLDLHIGTESEHGWSSLSSDQPELLSRKVSVVVNRLDEMVAAGIVGRPSFIKVDVEGAESLVLAGAQQVIRECRPVIILEVHPIQLLSYGWPQTKWCDWADENDYRAWLLHKHIKPRILSRDLASSVNEGNLLMLPRCD